MNCIQLSVTLNIDYNMLIYQFNLTFNRLSLKPHSRSIVYAKTQNQAFHKEFLKRTQLLLFNK